MNKDEQDVWAPLRFFVGSWEGGSSKSKTERDYEFILEGKFLRVRNKSTFKPTEKNPKGEIHEDIGISAMTTIERFLFSDNSTWKGSLTSMF